MAPRPAMYVMPQANRAQILKWLGQNVIDPNDPRNAPLLELLKAHEAQNGGMVGAGVSRAEQMPANMLTPRKNPVL